MPSVLLTLVLTFSYVRLTKCIKRTYNEGCHVYVCTFPRVLYSKVLLVIRMNMVVNIRIWFRLLPVLVETKEKKCRSHTFVAYLLVVWEKQIRQKANLRQVTDGKH
jgi:uncharacterized membrane protein